jgi:hypothetical protein
VGPTLVTVLKNSIFVCVSGGDNTEIANAIFRKMGTGCNTNGSTSVTVYDREGYSPPYPSYDIKFQRPNAVSVKFAIQIAASSSLPTYLTAAIKAAVVARFNGSDELGERERIGGSIFASRYSDAVAIGGARILSILIGVGAPAPSLNVLPMGINEQPTISESNISITYI